jgi:hypothetical protein
MKKDMWNREKGEWIRVEFTMWDNFKEWWNNIDWGSVILGIIFFSVVLLFLFLIGSAIYFITPLYCKVKSSVLGFNDYKYIFPNCYIKTVDLGWYPIEEYL